LIGGLLVWVHVLAVFWLVTGIVGRALVMSRAGRTSDLGELRTLLGISHIFETRMVRPGTLVVFLAGLLAAWKRGWPILGFLQGATMNWVLVSILIYLSIIPVIVFVFLPRGKAFRLALDDAVGLNQMTPALRAALMDPAVRAARVYEVGMVVVLTWIMVNRPF